MPTPHGDDGQTTLNHAQQGLAELDEHLGDSAAREDRPRMKNGTAIRLKESQQANMRFTRSSFGVAEPANIVVVAAAEQWQTQPVLQQQKGAINTPKR